MGENKEEIVKREYLGDGVYASYDGFHVKLEANIPTTDTIYLDPYVVSALKRYLNRMSEGEQL